MDFNLKKRRRFETNNSSESTVNSNTELPTTKNPTPVVSTNLPELINQGVINPTPVSTNSPELVNTPVVLTNINPNGTTTVPPSIIKSFVNSNTFIQYNTQIYKNNIGLNEKKIIFLKNVISPCSDKNISNIISHLNNNKCGCSNSINMKNEIIFLKNEISILKNKVKICLNGQNCPNINTCDDYHVKLYSSERIPDNIIKDIILGVGKDKIDSIINSINK